MSNLEPFQVQYPLSNMQNRHSAMAWSVDARHFLLVHLLTYSRDQRGFRGECRASFSETLDLSGSRAPRLATGL